MIVGLGVDITEVERVRAAIERQGERLLKRVYTEKEQTYCSRISMNDMRGDSPSKKRR